MPQPRLTLTRSRPTLRVRSLLNNVANDPGLTELPPRFRLLSLKHKQTRTVCVYAIVQWRAGRRWRLREPSVTPPHTNGCEILIPTDLTKYERQTIDFSRPPCAPRRANGGRERASERAAL